MKGDFYKRYICSDEQKQTEQDRMVIDDYKCVMCVRPSDKTRQVLQVYHITYTKHGHKDVMTDLVIL